MVIAGRGMGVPEQNYLYTLKREMTPVGLLSLVMFFNKVQIIHDPPTVLRAASLA
jgi:hypothetical protein